MNETTTTRFHNGVWTVEERDENGLLVRVGHSSISEDNAHIALHAPGTTYADHCEELISDNDRTFVTRPCRGKGLTINVHPDGTTRKVLCSIHSKRAYMSGYHVDWDESERVFGTKRPQDTRPDRIR